MGFLYKQMRSDVIRSYNAVRTKFPDYDNYSVEQKYVLLDMQYNMNGKFNSNKYKNFFASIRENPPNWERASRECRTMDEQNNVEINVPRNDWRSNNLMPK